MLIIMYHFGFRNTARRLFSARFRAVFSGLFGETVNSYLILAYRREDCNRLPDGKSREVFRPGRAWDNVHKPGWGGTENFLKN